MYSEYLKLNYSKLSADLGDLSDIQEVYNKEKSFKNVDFVDKLPLVCFDAKTFLSIPIDYFKDEVGKFY